MLAVESDTRNNDQDVYKRQVSTGYMYRKRFITVKEIRQMPGGICLICTLSFATISAGGCVPDIFP